MDEGHETWLTDFSPDERHVIRSEYSNPAPPR